MNRSLSILTTLLFSLAACIAKQETWTSSDGKKVVMELRKVTTDEGSLTGHFSMSNGKTFTLPEERLSDIDRERLQSFLDANALEENEQEAEQNNSDTYTEHLKGNLVVAGKKGFDKISAFQAPEKYYLFYKTASWCGPCVRFTPDLVKFYKRKKSKYEGQFEVILLTADNSEDEMFEYAKDKKMEWPQLSFDAVSDFKRAFPMPGRGIPNTILTDTKGNILKTSYTEDGKYLGPSVPMEYLEDLLKEDS